MDKWEQEKLVEILYDLVDAIGTSDAELIRDRIHRLEMDWEIA